MHDTSEGGESPLLMIDHKNEPEAETKQSTRSTKYNPWTKEEVLKLWSLVPTLGNSYRRMIYASLSIQKLLPDQKPVPQLEEEGAEIFV